MNGFLQDIRYCLRQWRRSPGFTVVASVTLALGVGVNTAIFLLTYTILLNSLPVSHPEELVRYYFIKGDADIGLSYPQYEALRSRQKATSNIFAWSNQRGSIGTNGNQEQVILGLATGSVFSVLDLRPYIGRTFNRAAGERGQPFLPEAMLSYDYWKTHFVENSNVVGSSLLGNNTR